jgi:predicted alpha/beta-hydrolase family hydrolase
VRRLKSPSELTVQVPKSAGTTALVYSAAGNGVGAALILAHGAGAGQRSPFMIDFADALTALGVDVVTFNFLYTEQRRRLPDRGPALEACYRSVVDAVRDKVASARRLLFVGGKSMGGRIATQMAAADRALPIGGLVLLGYPLHPPGRPGRRRDAHLPAVGRPMLFVQGSRDAFGTPSELAPVLGALAPTPTLHVVEGGDHSFKLSRKDPAAQAAVYADIQRTIVEWIQTIIDPKSARSPNRQFTK